MKRASFFKLLCTCFLLIGCSDSELIENWKNPDIESFTAQKVLVLAITNHEQNRIIFESRLVKELQEKGVNAVKSDTFFNQHFTSRPRTEEELAALEDEMLLEGYDAILVSKVIGAENKVTLVQSYRNYNRTFDNFGADYYSNQNLYKKEERLEEYVVYHAQSTLYCICPEEDRQVIWRASIDVTKLDTDKKAVKDYVNMLLWALEEQNLLIARL